MLDGRPERNAPFRIDLRAERLWHDRKPVPLRPKTWAVLLLLSARAGELVTKEELLDGAWPGTVVSEGILNKSIAELRSALGDDRVNPRFIETVPRRGFRWIAGDEIVIEPGAPVEPAAAPARPIDQVGETRPPLVGRDAELATLELCFTRAAADQRRVVFVTGEAGAGKSTLVEALLARLEEKQQGVRIAHGQCTETYGQHEPYGPLLEALERLVRRPDIGASVVAALQSSAPNWLRQMPSLRDPTAPAEAPPATSPGRMLRELATVLEELSRDRPLVLVLEDVHWADLATTDACNLLARRRDPARLLIIVTLREADALVARHPMLAAKTELVSRGLATEIPVTLFTPTFVKDYLAERCDGLDVDPAFASWIHHQTAGNPLFIRILVDDLILRGVLAMDEERRWRLRGSPEELREFVPDSLRELVEGQVDRLSTTERDLTESASVLAMEFAASSVAAVAGIHEEQAEEACEGLARRGQILKRAGRGNPGTGSRSGRFAFVHSMVQRILRERLPASRLRRLHLAAAEALEREHPGREDAVAVQLALHYAMAGEPGPALANLQRAAASIQRIPAPREVIVIREQILDLVERSPDLPGHRRERVVATMDLAEARQLAYAVVDSETRALCERVLELAVREEDGRERFLASMGIFSNHFYSGRYDEARELGRRLLIAAQRFGHPFMIKSARFAIAGAAYRLGDFAEAREHFEDCLRHEAGSQQTYGWDFQSMSLSHLALLEVHAGRPEEARRFIREADGRERREGAAPDAAVVPLFAYTLAMLGDDAEAMVHVQRALSQSDRIGAAAWIERARFVNGLLVSRGGRAEEGIRLMTESLARQARNEVHIDRSAYCCLLAQEMLERGVAGAEAIVDEGIAFMERSGERHFESGLRRLRGELSAANGNDSGGSPS